MNASASVVSQLSPFELAFGFAQPSRSLTGLRAADALLPPVQAATVQAPPATETQMAALDEQRDRLLDLDELRADARATQVAASAKAFSSAHTGTVHKYRASDLVWLYWPHGRADSKISRQYVWTGPWYVRQFDQQSQRATLSPTMIDDLSSTPSTTSTLASSSSSTSTAASASTNSSVTSSSSTTTVGISELVVVSAHARRLRPFSAQMPIVKVAGDDEVTLLPTPGIFSASGAQLSLDSIPQTLRHRIEIALEESKMALARARAMPTTAAAAPAPGAAGVRWGRGRRIVVVVVVVIHRCQRISMTTTTTLKVARISAVATTIQ